MGQWLTTVYLKHRVLLLPQIPSTPGGPKDHSRPRFRGIWRGYGEPPPCDRLIEATEVTVRNEILGLSGGTNFNEQHTSGSKNANMARIPAGTICIANGALHDVEPRRRPVAIVIPAATKILPSFSKKDAPNYYLLHKIEPE